MSFKNKLWNLILYIKNGDPKINLNFATLSMGQELKGKNIIVTGGSKGLGLAIAKKCIDQGASIIITGRNEQDLQETQIELGTNCHYLKHDVSNTDEVDVFFEKAASFFSNKKIDAIVNNAGVSLHEKGFLNVTASSWDKQMDINLKGTYFFTQGYIRFIEKTNQEMGNVLIISSERGLSGDSLPYGLSKVALNSLVQGLSKKYIGQGIRVNGIAPGVTATSMTGININDNLYRPDAIGKRFFIPEEIAEVAEFLLSDRANCISGEVIACDQGHYLSNNWRQ